MVPVSELPLWIGGRPRTPNLDLEVHDKHSGARVARVPLADDALIDEAIGRACVARAEFARWPAWRRARALAGVARSIDARREAFVECLVREAGKPLRDARGEVQRAIETFEAAAREAVSVTGEVLELATSASGEGRRGQWKRVPVGVASFVTPFNFPLNLVAHKVAPAIAAGCPFVLKPASSTPISALRLAECLAREELPDGAFSILPARRGDAGRFSSDPRLALLSFTGSDEVGWELKRRAAHMRVVLELGGNAAVIVEPDWPLEDALERTLVGAFAHSGQSCISVQRILVHDACYDAFRTGLVRRVEALGVGDPSRAETVVGPLVSESEAARVASWIEDARQAGGRVLCGGERQGAIVRPAVLEDVPPDCRIVRDEAFGPVVVLDRYADLEDALERVNASRYGLQAGLFTDSVEKTHRAWDLLEVGGLMIGDVPSWRIDPMPYGGVKASGEGREGPRYAIRDLTEMRLIAYRDRPRT